VYLLYPNYAEIEISEGGEEIFKCEKLGKERYRKKYRRSE